MPNNIFAAVLALLMTASAFGGTIAILGSPVDAGQEVSVA